MNLTVKFLFGFLIVTTLSCKKDSTEPITEVEDIEGNVYQTVEIESRIWMAENLKTATLNDGTPINQGSGNWDLVLEPVYADYDYTPTNSDIYGKLYNYYVVETGKICPVGWHVPSEREWKSLIGTETDLGAIATKLKSTTGWLPLGGENQNGSNESGFNALPAGHAMRDSFYELGAGAWIWSGSRSRTGGSAYAFQIYHEVYINSVPENWGLSVRCVKN